MSEYIMTLDEAMTETKLLEDYKYITPLHDITREAILEAQIIDEQNYIAIMESLAKAELKYYVSNKKPLFESVTPITEGVVRDFFDRIIKWFRGVIDNIVALWKAMIRKITGWFDKDRDFVANARKVLSSYVFKDGINAGKSAIDTDTLVHRVDGTVDISSKFGSIKKPSVHKIEINNSDRELSEIQNDPNWVLNQSADILDALYAQTYSTGFRSRLRNENLTIEDMLGEVRFNLKQELGINGNAIDVQEKVSDILNYMESITKAKADLTKLFNGAITEFTSMLSLLQSLKNRENPAFMPAYEKIIQVMKFNVDLSKEILGYHLECINNRYAASKEAIEKVLRKCQLEFVVDTDAKESFRETTLDDILRM